MEAHGADTLNWEQIQWVFTTVTGAFTMIYGAVLTYIFKEIERLNAKQDGIIKTALEQADKGDERLRSVLEAVRARLEGVCSREELESLRRKIDDNQTAAAKDRENIAVMMATRAQVEQKFEQFYERILTAMAQKTKEV